MTGYEIEMVFKTFDLKKLVENCDEVLLMDIAQYFYILGENQGAFVYSSSGELNEQLLLFNKIKSYEKERYYWNLNGKIQQCDCPIGY